jgi:hypothetical protein
MIKIAPSIASIDVDQSQVNPDKVKQLLSEMLQAYQELRVTKPNKTSRSDDK